MASIINMTSNSTIWQSDHPPQASETTNAGQVTTDDDYIYRNDAQGIYELWKCTDASNQNNLQWVKTYPQV